MRVGVVGAGIVGATAALLLALRGHEVTLLDRSGGEEAAAMGNAGAFAFADVIPLATPGIWRRAPLWLLDPDGPLSVPPAYALRLAPWLWRFALASRPSRYRAAVAAQAALMDLSRAALGRLAAAEGLDGMLRREGQLQLYEGEAAFRAARPSWEERRRAGVRFDLLEGAQALAAVQPGLAPRFTHAGFTPDWSNVTDPALWTRELVGRALRRGAVERRLAVERLRPVEGGVEVAAGGEALRFERVVVAAGAWSRPLAAQVGADLPLDTERGYNTTLPAGAFDLRTHLTFEGHGFVVSRIGEGVRVGGAVELGGLSRPPRMARAEALLRKARAFLPGLRVEGGRPWMGFRPSLPDSLPAIGPAPRDPRVILAFGHGHLGLTQSPGTAEIVADLVEGRAPAIGLAPYSPTRFSRAA